jgi:hypothetical protein
MVVTRNTCCACSEVHGKEPKAMSAQLIRALRVREGDRLIMENSKAVWKG